MAVPIASIYARVQEIKSKAQSAIVLCQNMHIPIRQTDHDQLWLVYQLEQAWAHIAQLDEPFSDSLADIREAYRV